MIACEPTRVTRLAPSPTGALHLGNARTFLVTWALARQRGWRLVMRMEDLDTPRIKPAAAQQALDDLHWLGMDWDLPSPGQAWTQKADLAPYHEALRKLASLDLLYACQCTRTEIERAQSAPHAEDHELRYPGLCRERCSEVTDLSSWPAGSCLRLKVPQEPVEFADEIAGVQRMNVQEQIGDFIVATKAALPSYQLAVVVDDHRQGVTDVIRGDDLLTSAARQIWIYRMLGLTPLPRYWHLPLVVGPDGMRLAKRHGDARLATFRERSIKPERVIGVIAHWCGLLPVPRPMSAREFVQAMDLSLLPRDPITLTPEVLAWLGE